MQVVPAGILKWVMSKRRYYFGEVFRYLEHADKPCLVAIDEFQVIAKYPENNVEALLRTQIQHCNNIVYFFGLQRQYG